MPTHTESLSRSIIGTRSYDPSRGELLDEHGTPVHLRPQAVRALEHLLANAGKLVSRDELMAAVWPDVVVTDDSLVQCIGDIRRALGDENHRLLQTVPRRGYRLEAGAPSPAQPDADRQGEPATPPRADPRVRRSRAIALAAGVALVLGGLVAVKSTQWFADWEEGALSNAGATLSVLPARCDGPVEASPQARALNQGYALELAADLARNTDVKLAFAAAGDGTLRPDAAARELGVRYVVKVCAQVAAAVLNQTVQLVDATSGKLLWKDELRSSVERLTADREALLRHIARSVHATLHSGSGAPLLRGAPGSLDDYVLVTRAAAAAGRFDRDEYRNARDDLARVLQRQPGYAAAWAVAGALGAFDAWAHVSGDLPEAREPEVLAQIERALALDPRLALPYQARSLALVSADRRPDALAAAQRAVELAPGDPTGLVVLANALLATGRMKEAMQTIEQAQSQGATATSDFDYVRAKALWGVQRTEEAVAAASRCIERTPQFAACRGVRALASDAMGRLEAARLDLKAYRDAVPGELPQGPGSYPGKEPPKLLSDWLTPIRRELGLS